MKGLNDPIGIKSSDPNQSPFITNPYRFAAAGGGIGGWVELGRHTLGSGADLLDVSSLPDKRYYMLLSDIFPSGSTTVTATRLNGDTGSNYAERRSLNGAADEPTGSNTYMIQHGVGVSQEQFFEVGYLANLAAKEKLYIGHSNTNCAGAGTAPSRQEWTEKWSNTSDAIDQISKVQTIGGADYASGSELVILGWDPADTHTCNFWEELASVTTGSAGDTLQSGTIPAKKYLWIQASYKNDGAADINALPRFNGDAGSNYASRTSTNGAADSTRTGRTWVDLESGNQRARFVNMFIINNASNEKLCIWNQMDYGASGAGNAPNRIEGVGKWTNTSNQITSIEWDQRDAGDYAAGAELRVWGSD